MVSDAELVGGIRNFLRSSDLKNTTVSIVRRKLEVDFGVDLSQRKPFLRQQVEIFLYHHVQEKSDDDAHVDAGSDFSDRSDDDSDSDDYDRTGGTPPAVVDQKTNGRPSAKGSATRRLNKDDEKTVIRSKSCILSPQLQKFLGASQMLRFEVLNQLWDYVSQQNLIDPNDKQNILCDPSLQQLFGVDSFKVFQMNTFLSKHLSAAKPSKKRKPRKRDQAVEDETEQNSSDPKRQKRVVTSGFLSPSPISPSFIRFLGTGEQELTRPDAIKRVWVYIKEHNLQDPLNKRMILCDEKLKELFEVNSFNGFTVSKLLTAHFVKQS